MNFQEALELIERKKDILGSTTEKGVTIDLILVVPTDSEQREAFVQILMLTRSPQQAILPFTNGDVEVWATSSNCLYNQNILFYKVLTE